MTPGKSSAQGSTLKIIMPDGLRYIPAHVFDTAKGIAFASLDWDDPFAFGQPVHELIGECHESDSGWFMNSHRGTVNIQVLPDSSEAWKAWMKAGRGGNRQSCWERIADTLGLDDEADHRA
ncbi:MAG: hypothetical protein ACR2PT_07455 [Endozoicomonas sp.]